MPPEFSAEILRNNLERVRASPALIRQLEEVQPGDVALEFTDSALPRLKVGGQDVYAPGNPVEQAAREVAGFLEDKQPDVVVFFGLGLGLHSRFLELKAAVPVLIFEPRLDVLAQVLPRIPLEFESAELITNSGHLVERTSKFLSATNPSVAAGAIPSYGRLFPAEFQAFREALNQALKRIEIDQSTKALFADDWVDHLRLNLPTLVKSPPLAALPPVFAGRPGILVGAGPSLDDNIEVLARAQDRALICAVHTAVQPMARLGLVPHITTMLEGHLLEHFFTDVPDLERTYLALDPQTHPRHLELGFKGLLQLNQEGRTSADWLERALGYAPLPSGGSVACATLAILHHLGCDPIILVGMDTAFTHGRTHSLHSEAGCCRVAYDPGTGTITYTYLDGRPGGRQFEGHEVEAWGGRGTVPTRHVYSSFRYWFEAAGQTWAADRTLINATEGGARFQGFAEMTLDEALSRYCQEPLAVSDMLDGAISDTPLPDTVPLGESINLELEAVQAAAGAALQILNTAARVLKLLRARQLNRVQPLLDQLARAEKSLQAQTSRTRLLNSLIGHKVTALARKKSPAKDPVQQTIHSVELSLEIARIVDDGARDLLEKYRPLAAEFLGS